MVGNFGAADLPIFLCFSAVLLRQHNFTDRFSRSQCLHRRDQLTHWIDIPNQRANPACGTKLDQFLLDRADFVGIAVKAPVNAVHAG